MEKLLQEPEKPLCLPGETFDKKEEICYQQINCNGDQCIKQGDQILEKLENEFGSFLEETSEIRKEETFKEIASFDVINGKLENPRIKQVNVPSDLPKLKKIWHMFSDIIPLDERKMVHQFHVFTDGLNGELAEVHQDEQDRRKWALHLDFVDSDHPKLLISTLIHEFGHLLTLNEKQLPLNKKLPKDQQQIQQLKEECSPHYFDEQQGCSHPQSYINAFYQRFWVNMMDEWKKYQVQESPEHLLSFYEKHKDQFVTDYATYHIEEDLAESWTYFIFTKHKQPTSIKEEKIAFFYNYPELVRLRAIILSRIYSKMLHLKNST